MWGWYRRRSSRWQVAIGVMALVAVLAPFTSADQQRSGARTDVAATSTADGGDIADQLPFAETTTTTMTTELPPTTEIPPTTVRPSTTTTAAPARPPTTPTTQAFVAPAPEPVVTADSGCHPSYDPCLPITGDLDCGDIGRPVQVHGRDDYRLDADGDGRGCESY